MTFYKDFQNNLMDRYDLKFSVYIAALDIQFSYDLPYLWTFCFDLTGEVFYGRSWDHLREFFEILETKGHFDYEHKLLVYINDLTLFYTYGRTQIDFDAEPFLAKSPSDVLLCSHKGLEFRDFTIYTEKDIDKYIEIHLAGVPHIKPDPDGLSELAELSENEMQYSALRVLEITKAMRYDIDTIYQGETRKVLLTKTRRIERILSNNLKKSDPTNQLAKQIYNKNPLSTPYGLEVVLPRLRKAFFGGTVFYEEGMLNKLIQNCYSADIISAYCAEFILSEFPNSKFENMKNPEHYQDLFTQSYYTSKAMLITFEARDIKLKKGGLAILPAAIKHYYVDRESPEERADAVKRAQRLKLKESKIIRMCLTDIDFKLFCRYYDFDQSSLKIITIIGARYGFLPDYIVKTVAELYQNKMISKEKRRKLKKAGLVDPLEDELYKDEKSSIARLYGIFTQSPVVVKYRHNPEKRNMEIEQSEYLVKDQRFRPVMYQWGVWTVARVREKLCSLRDELRGSENKITTISGDTDCINFKGDARDIITQFNKKINAMISWRCSEIGIDPASLKDLGTLEVEEYKYYRLTSAKQYAVVRETDSGEVFETICGGMNKKCTYFDDYSLKNFGKIDPRKQIEHFRLGLVIPADKAPRVIKRQCNGTKKISFIDRDGNKIQREIESYQIEQNMKFSLCDPFSSLIFKNKPAAFDTSNQDYTAEDVINATAERVAHISTHTPEIPEEIKKKKKKAK